MINKFNVSNFNSPALLVCRKKRDVKMDKVEKYKVTIRYQNLNMVKANVKFSLTRKPV